MPRKKFRFRCYPSEKNIKWFQETKISSVEGKYKTSKKIDNDLYLKTLKCGFFDSQYGSCFPTIKISYTREYWSIADSRITIDYNIKYENFKDNEATFEDKERLIVELKSAKDLIKNLNFLNDNLPFERQRFSKYCEGINRLYNKDHHQRLQNFI